MQRICIILLIGIMYFVVLFISVVFFYFNKKTSAVGRGFLAVNSIMIELSKSVLCGNLPHIIHIIISSTLFISNFYYAANLDVFSK